MGKRGPKPKGKVKIEWSPNFAYAIGLIASDGNLSSNGRHIVFVSKDSEQIENFLRALGIENHISRDNTKIWRVQFSDVLFYRFLITIGLIPNKSKILRGIEVPEKYFFHFLRGVFDGDGSTYSYWDKRWRSSFMYYVCFASASPVFIEWLRIQIETSLLVKGHVTHSKGKNTGQLKYAKQDGLKLLRRMYAGPKASIHLSRKYLKIQQMLSIVGERL